MFAVLTNLLVWFVCTVVHISCFFEGIKKFIHKFTTKNKSKYQYIAL